VACNVGSIVIRIAPFQPEYAPGVVSLILPIQREEFGVAVTLEDQPDLLDIPGFYLRGAGGVWVALADREVVGTVGALDIGNARVALRKMFVKASYRGPEHRVAARLLASVRHACEANAVRDVFLGTTVRYLAAHRFYEKNGFREIQRDELPPAFPIMRVDTKFYHWRREG
jgi:GNAT superfamily N-acetyltransferase